MKQSLVLACGNSLRGDDGVGPRVAEQLSEQLKDPRTEVSCSHQWTPELAEKISKADIAVFVDASAKLGPGQIQVRSVAAGPGRTGATTHSLNPERLLLLAGTLYGRVPERVFLLTIGGKSFAPGEELSPIVRNAIPAVIARIKSLLEDSVSA